MIMKTLLVLDKNRLDVLAEAGIPLWITELDVNEKNATKRADALEKILKLAFSHKAVEGIMLWSLWSEGADAKYSSLADNKNFEVSCSTNPSTGT